MNSKKVFPNGIPPSGGSTTSSIVTDTVLDTELPLMSANVMLYV